VKTASEVTSIVSGGALNSTQPNQTKPKLVLVLAVAVVVITYTHDRSVI